MTTGPLGMECIAENNTITDPSTLDLKLQHTNTWLYDQFFEEVWV